MLSLARRIGYRRGECLALACLALTFHHLGNHHLALECSQQALQITHEIGNRTIEGYALTYLGHAQAGLGHLPDAATTYQEAFTLRQQLDTMNLAMEPLAGLARLCLAQGDLPQAVAHVEQILSHLENDSLEGTLEPVRIYLTCYRILQANESEGAPAGSRLNRGREEEILHTAHQLLQERAAKISSKKIRRMYLENVTAHRELVYEFDGVGTRIKE
jgi:tetratricopeptide (TPR) repeat protein